MVHPRVRRLDRPPKAGVSWRMIRPLVTAVGFALLAPPVVAQVGLSSSAQTVVLTATKHGSVRVALPLGSSSALPGSLGLGPNDVTPLAIETAWDLDPSSASAVTLRAFFRAPAAGTAGGTVVLFSQPVTGGGAGRRTDRLEMRLDVGGWTARPPGPCQGTLNLLAITQ